MDVQTPSLFVGYRVDARDVLEEVSGAFADFARENGAAGLETRVVGTSLWGHVVGREVQAIYRDLLAHVRRTGRPVVFPYRCDAPGRRRYLEMRMRPAAREAVEFESKLLREVPRASVEWLEPERQTEPDLLVVCAWCRRFDIGAWVEAEEAIGLLGLFDQRRFPAMSHGICDACKATAVAALGSAPGPGAI